MKISILLFISVLLLTNCKPNNESEVVIFHAGSLTVPIHKCIEAYKQVNSSIKIKPEAAGSLSSARKLTELNRDCDLLMLADHTIIDKLIIPEYAPWNLVFASNELSIVYLPTSRYATEITKENWFDIIMRPDVFTGRADPNKDPCGYRTIMTLLLAEKTYNKPNLTNLFLQKDFKYMRSKETDLIPLLESGEIDYIFLYRSVAVQHNLKALLLSDSVNLKKPSLNDFYESVSVKVSGQSPTDSIVLAGKAITYGLTIPKNSKNKEEGLKFLQFMLQQDHIWKEQGQPLLTPLVGINVEKMPEEIQNLTK